MGRSYVNYDKGSFQHDIRHHPNWNVYWSDQNNDPNILWGIMYTIILDVVDYYCPLKKMSFRTDSPEWINKEMIYEISHKDSLYNKAKLSEDPTDWTTFRTKKNEVKKLLSSAKEEFIKDKLESLKDNPRKFWRIINEMSGIGKNTKKGKGCSKIADDNGQIYENIDAAIFLNKYYVNVGPTLAKDHKIDWDKAICKIDATTHFSFTWINEQEVRNLVKDINITKSSAREDLSSRLLKDSFEVLIMELTYLYNISLQNGIFPDTWGISRVTPIPKTNCSSKKPGDWRPISQIALPGKILERIIHIQLYNYLNNNNLLSN